MNEFELIINSAKNNTENELVVKYGKYNYIPNLELVLGYQTTPEITNTDINTLYNGLRDWAKALLIAFKHYPIANTITEILDNTSPTSTLTIPLGE